MACACKPFFRTRWLGGFLYQCRVTVQSKRTQLLEYLECLPPKLACACKPFFRTRWLGGFPYQCRKSFQSKRMQLLEYLEGLPREDG
ncbi:BQ5605_C002g01249 [Microbotryum silenes-dioicae]|uniref:BQ5605_C002g01249 protein n=1 Tax=Microbotryum silenes-dioicae TaxID=796604 RepID=A0A2X0P1E6_9BASI|nr:BQ5605_C002g01249 [Microbotryum silenes-dioicae]